MGFRLQARVFGSGAPIKAIGGTRSDARTQAILVRGDSPIKSAADLKGKRLAGTRGGWGQFLINATLEKAGSRIEDATFAPLGPVDAKIALLALFGAVVGQAVVWYTGQFYALFYLEKMLRVDGATTNILIAIALAIGTPFFIFFGWLSDKVGRKPLLLIGSTGMAATLGAMAWAFSGAQQDAGGKVFQGNGHDSKAPQAGDCLQM